LGARALIAQRGIGHSNLADVGNVEWALGSGGDLAVIPSRSVDDVFS
jgi:hypothetical protein